MKPRGQREYDGALKIYFMFFTKPILFFSDFLRYHCAMMNFSLCQNLFNHSSFFALKRDEELNREQREIFSQLVFPDSISLHHPNRKEEFKLGRLCASLAHLKLKGETLNVIPVGTKREPIFPSTVVGSISHTKEWIGAVVADSNKLVGVGLDFENMGRAKKELSRYISTDSDVTKVDGMSEEEVLTLIFSAKESLYKALYPSVKIFFGFDSAAVTKIDTQSKTFTIELLTQLSSHFGPNGRFSFTGRFCCDSQICLTAIEVTYI
jgi:enterobactin synthetase component D